MSFGTDQIYIGITESSTDEEKLNVVFKVLHQNRIPIYLAYRKLKIHQNKEKLFDAKLINTNFVDVGETGAYQPNFILNHAGHLMLEEYGDYIKYIQTQQVKQKELSNKKEEKENLEMQKLRTENIVLLDKLTDFPNIKKERNWLRIIAIIELLAILVGLILQWKSKS